MEEKRFFIVKDNDNNLSIRWVHTFIRKDIEWDTMNTHLVVSMKNNFNSPTGPKDCLIENVDVKNFFATEKDAKIEILLRERFDTTKVVIKY
jgi:hypothetical protein